MSMHICAYSRCSSLKETIYFKLPRVLVMCILGPHIEFNTSKIKEQQKYMVQANGNIRVISFHAYNLFGLNYILFIKALISLKIGTICLKKNVDACKK